MQASRLLRILPRAGLLLETRQFQRKAPAAYVLQYVFAHSAQSRQFHVSFALRNMSAEDLNKRMENVNSQFAEARLLIEDALDAQGTKYFEEDLADAETAVKDCIKAYNEMLEALDDKRRGETQRSMGMKMEQLKGELAQIINALTHDEELPPAKS